MELKVKGTTVTSLKVQNPFCFKLEIMDKNYHRKYLLATMMHQIFMGHQVS